MLDQLAGRLTWLMEGLLSQAEVVAEGSQSRWHCTLRASLSGDCFVPIRAAGPLHCAVSVGWLLCLASQAKKSLSPEL